MSASQYAMFKDVEKKLQTELCAEMNEKDYALSSTSENDNESEGADSADETD